MILSPIAPSTYCIKETQSPPDSIHSWIVGRLGTYLGFSCFTWKPCEHRSHNALFILAMFFGNIGYQAIVMNTKDAKIHARGSLEEMPKNTKTWRKHRRTIADLWM